MSLDVITDPQVAALIGLSKGAVNAELQAELTENAIEGTFNHPRPLAILGDSSLPALAVYRRSERKVRRTNGRIERRVVFVFDFICRPVGIDEIELRWPLLQRVWEELWSAIDASKHDAVAGGAEVLELAGFTEIESDTAEVSYDYAPQERTAFPFFRALIVGWHREKTDISTLADFRELWARYHLMGEGAVDQNPVVVSLAQAHRDATEEEIEEEDAG